MYLVGRLAGEGGDDHSEIIWHHGDHVDPPEGGEEHFGEMLF